MAVETFAEGKTRKERAEGQHTQRDQHDHRRFMRHMIVETVSMVIVSVGALAVVALKGQKMLLLRVNDAGALTELRLPPEFDDKYGRLRAARTGPDGALYVTTSDGTNDKLLRVTAA